MGAPVMVSPAPRLHAWLHRHGDKLWWLHSLYSLALGVGAMWLSKRSPVVLRAVLVQVALIWISTLLLPSLPRLHGLGAAWRERLRLAVQWGQRNLYQQALFFVLPLYAASCTVASANVVFVGLLGLSALLATLDIVYDRHLSVRWGLLAPFFAFNLLACANAVLPAFLRIAPSRALLLSAALALAGFSTLTLRLARVRWNRKLLFIAAAALLLGLLSGPGRFLVPPVPLSMARAEFAAGIEPRTLELVSPLASLEAGRRLPVTALTRLRAPLGLSERVSHRWFLADRLLHATPLREVRGGRRAGYRLWSWATVGPARFGDRLRLDVVTEGGQLVGRARLRCR